MVEIDTNGEKVKTEFSKEREKRFSLFPLNRVIIWESFKRLARIGGKLKITSFATERSR